MSGGVDSSVAAALTLKQGFHCVGVTLKLYAGENPAPEAPACPSPAGLPDRKQPRKLRGCCSLADVNDARQAAYQLGIAHYVLNFTEPFREEVIRRFIETYEGGGTPNPCIDCNRYIKFDRLLYRARELDFDILVTGHYARIEEANGRYLLKKSLDSRKDQSYVLYAMTQEQLGRGLFPLGNLTKDKVREIAREMGFLNAAKQDSQDICFVPGGDYGAFMESYTGKHYPPGDIINQAGQVLGRHRGLVRYTIGQRRGLAVAVNEPYYVCAKTLKTNTLTLGPESSLYSRVLHAGNINIIPWDRLEKAIRVKVKTRYLQNEQWAAAEQIAPDRLRVEFDQPQRAITPGQAAVLYDVDLVIGGGTILPGSNEQLSMRNEE
jgi:tRNA-specific 2-thiouridylase